jgi:S-adenosylmethionine:tRNA ribosyltransferase-isomerase
MLTLDDFDYLLPPERIAQMPLAERADSRLLVMRGTALADHAVRDLPDLLLPNDLLVMNDTRVIHARLFGRKESGGQVEVLVERITPEGEVIAQLRASKPPRAGSRLRLEDAFDAEVLGRAGEFWRLTFAGDAFALIERHGRLPLPPYIEHAATKVDEERYQTVFAREKGSVAAPTAGLHFDPPLLTALAERGIATAQVTLHVGAGTFQPVRVHHLAEHRMHRERYHVPAATVAAIAACRERGGRVVAVGTTTLRTLETAALHGSLRAGSGESELFVTPGFEFRVVDMLMTNFHLPKSTLLMLVSAFGGLAEIRAAYRHAIAHNYRFFSYGDAMLIDKACPSPLPHPHPSPPLEGEGVSEFALPLKGEAWSGLK